MRTWFAIMSAFLVSVASGDSFGGIDVAGDAEIGGYLEKYGDDVRKFRDWAPSFFKENMAIVERLSNPSNAIFVIVNRLSQDRITQVLPLLKRNPKVAELFLKEVDHGGNPFVDEIFNSSRKPILDGTLSVAAIRKASEKTATEAAVNVPEFRKHSVADRCPRPKLLDENLDVEELQYTTNEAGWVVWIDRSRVYEKLKLRHPISAKMSDDGFVDDSGAKVPVYPFQYARVKCIEIDGDAIGKVTKLPLETISLTGVEGLETLILKGTVPEFDEKKVLLGLKRDSSWRRNLKRVVVATADIEGVLKLPFISDVKILEFDKSCEKILIERLKQSKSDWFAGCRSLIQIVVPYEMAKNRDIKWGKIIRQTSLKDKEVVAYDLGKAETVLLNVASSGEVSDIVTALRSDAVTLRQEKIFLPFKLKDDVILVEGGLGKEELEDKFFLKKNSVLFSPDLLKKQVREDLENVVGPSEFCPVMISSAYENLTAIDVCQDRIGTNEFTSAGLVAKSNLNLLRGRNVTHSIAFAVKLGDSTYNVRYPNSAKIEVIFRKNPTSWWKPFVLWAIWLFVLCGSCSVAYGFCPKISAVLQRCLPTTWTDVLVKCLGFRKRSVRTLIGGSIFIVLGVSCIVFSCPDYGWIQYWVDKHLTRSVMSYLDGSFVSSLVISLLTTSLQLIVGFLQGLSAGFVVNFNVEPILQPIQDALSRISSFSWVSTCVLALLRILCQLIRDSARYVWATVGISFILMPFLRLLPETMSKTMCRWCVYVLTMAAFLALGLPLFLCLCACVSNEVAQMSGEGFRTAMNSFGAIATSFSYSDLTSVDAIKNLLGLLSDAVTELVSASIFYIANKAFDCFVVPLGIYHVTKRVLAGFKSQTDSELIEIRERLSGMLLAGESGAPKLDSKNLQKESSSSGISGSKVSSATRDSNT